MTGTEPDLAGVDLVYVSDTDPGILRVRAGRGFRYRAETGREPSAADKRRAADLAIPPAWTDVWICRLPDGHIQATGRDDAGRKQYIYHPEWTRLRAEAKFDRLGAFGRRLPHLRRQVDTDLSLPGLPRRRVTALTVRLLDETLIRVGNDRYAESNGSYGLTTLGRRHVEVSGSRLHFSMTGKGGAEVDVSLRDRRLAALVLRCRDAGGRRLFTYEGDGTGGAVDSEDVNDYLREVAGETFSAKDFRTWGASAAVVRALGPGDDVGWLAAVDQAADLLGNTRSVCRAAYVHPDLETAWEGGSLYRAWRSSRRSRWLTRAESALAKLLDG